jgi:hypothetical protein
VSGTGSPAAVRASSTTFSASHELVVVGLAPVEAHALVVAHQVRRRVEPGPVAGRAQHRLEHRRGRALAVGAGHGDHRARNATSSRASTARTRSSPIAIAFGCSVSR